MKNIFSEAEIEHINLTKDIIKRMLDNKIESLECETELKQYIYDHCYISGGISASVFHGKPVNDIDVFFSVSSSCSEFIQKQFFELLETNYKNDIADSHSYSWMNVDGKVITENAITLKNYIQLIHYKHQRNMFDFIHCMPYYKPSADEYYISRNQYDSIANKKIILRDEKCRPASSRLHKYLKRGWSINVHV